MYIHLKLIRLALILSISALLSGCLGGTIAQQIAQSIVTRVADKAVARAMDVDEKEPSTTHSTTNQMFKSAPDPYRRAMLNMQFAPLAPIQEPLPDYPKEEQEIPVLIMKSNPLVKVELFNLLIGDEKTTLLEKARLQGSQTVPDPKEWKSWGLGTGVIRASNQTDAKMITFLIPPEFGKLPSGSTAMVEISNNGEMNIARYKSN
ncbi:MAG: hypothetical protein SFU55_01575 [Methylophilus sp.]|nr:hypothetical protein [Methylophilus sp.]